MSLVSKGAIFHFHDCWKKSSLLLSKYRLVPVDDYRFAKIHLYFCRYERPQKGTHQPQRFGTQPSMLNCWRPRCPSTMSMHHGGTVMFFLAGRKQLGGVRHRKGWETSKEACKRMSVCFCLLVAWFVGLLEVH